MAKGKGAVTMVLRRMPTQNAWAFLWGRTVVDAQVIAVDGKRYFSSRDEAVAAAGRVGLKVDKAGFVTSEGPNPNDPIMKRDPKHLNLRGVRSRHRNATVNNRDRKRYQIFAGAGSGVAKVVDEYHDRDDAMRAAEKHVRCNYVEVYDRDSDHILWSTGK